MYMCTIYAICMIYIIYKRLKIFQRLPISFRIKYKILTMTSMLDPICSETHVT